jgi:hypothetical protein
VGIVAALAVAGAVTAVLMLNPGFLGTTPLPGSGDEGGTTGGEGGTAATTVELQVPMYNPWTPTGLWCDAGEMFAITVTGEAWHDETPESLVGPDGLTGGEVPQARVFADANTASVIGGFDTTPEMFAVGSGTSHTCTAGGELQLGINDTYLVGNRGEFTATVTHYE